jgi:hypothetical protein
MNNIKQDLVNQYFLPVLGYGIVIIASLTGIVFLQNPDVKISKAQISQSEYVAQENVEKLQLEFLSKIPALGFDNLLADWLYLKFIQYFGDSEARDQVGYSLSPDYFTQVVKQDARFVSALLKLDTSTSVFAGYPQTSVDLLSHSLKTINPKLISHSTSPYYLWRAKGINELLFLGDSQAAKQSYQNAIQWAKEYNDSRSQNLIAVTEDTIKFLEKNPKSKVAQIGAWANVLGSSPDPRTFKRVVEEVKKLGGEVIISPDGRVTVKVPPDIE